MKTNPFLKTLPTYQPGRPIEEVARELGLPVDSIIKLASNENPFGPSPLAVAALHQAISSVHLYPDGNAFYLKQKLAAKCGVEPANLVLGNGSNEIIEFTGHALLEPDTNVVVSQYCFAIYPIVARMFGADVISVPARNFGHDLPAMLRAITARTRIVFVANPNNPTGTLAAREELIQFVNEVPEDVLLVMDEAYIEFLEEPLDLIPLIRLGARKNLILMRTFSKIYGLAGAGENPAAVQCQSAGPSRRAGRAGRRGARAEDARKQFRRAGLFRPVPPETEAGIRPLLREFHPGARGRGAEGF